MTTLRAAIGNALLRLARWINPPRIEGVYLVNAAGQCWRA